MLAAPGLLPPVLAREGGSVGLPYQLSDGSLIDHGAIVRRFGPRLYRYARQLACNANDAHDLVQDAFEKSLRKMPGGLSPVNIQCWLQVTLRNRYVDVRKSRLRRRHVALTDFPAPSANIDDSDEEPRWSRIDPSELWHCVQRLNPLLRDVFLLRNRDRRSHAEIAMELSIPVSTVGTRCFRAAKHLRRMLDAAVRP